MSLLTAIALAIIMSLVLFSGIKLGEYRQRQRTVHIHTWQLVGAHYRRPYSHVSSTFIRDNTVLKQMINGVTTVTERCSDPRCSEIRTRQLLGKVDIPEYEWTKDNA